MVSNARPLLLLGVLAPGNGRFLQLVGRAPHQHGIEIAGLVRDIQQDGVLDKAGLLHLVCVHHHIGQLDVFTCKLNGLVETLNRCRDTPYHWNAGHATRAVDEPLNNGALFPWRGTAHASVRLVQHQIQSHSMVFWIVSQIV
jgi:hypothetical protein